MVDESIEIPECDFSCQNDSPRNTLYYDLSLLTPEQQEKLNILKRQIIVENQRYLASNPEVRACIAVGLKNLMNLQPRHNVLETFVKYFAKPRIDLYDEIHEYISKMQLGKEDLTSVDSRAVCQEPKKKRKGRKKRDSSAFRTTRTSSIIGSPEYEIKFIIAELLYKVVSQVDDSIMLQQELKHTVSEVVDSFKRSYDKRKKNLGFMFSEQDMEDVSAVVHIVDYLVHTAVDLVENKQE